MVVVNVGNVQDDVRRADALFVLGCLELPNFLTCTCKILQSFQALGPSHACAVHIRHFMQSPLKCCWRQCTLVSLHPQPSQCSDFVHRSRSAANQALNFHNTEHFTTALAAGKAICSNNQGTGAGSSRSRPTTAYTSFPEPEASAYGRASCATKSMLCSSRNSGVTSHGASLITSSTHLEYHTYKSSKASSHFAPKLQPFGKGSRVSAGQRDRHGMNDARPSNWNPLRRPGGDGLASSTGMGIRAELTCSVVEIHIALPRSALSSPSACV